MPTKSDLSLHLKSWQDRAAAVIQLIENDSLADDDSTVRRLMKELRGELSEEYDRIMSLKEQQTMGVYERTVYLPCVEDAWTRNKIRRLRLEGPIDGGWIEAVEAVLYHLGKYSE